MYMIEELDSEMAIMSGSPEIRRKLMDCVYKEYPELKEEFFRLGHNPPETLARLFGVSVEHVKETYLKHPAVKEYLGGTA